ncbi:hypothetical protein CANCADRAFT_128055 [Tortispora caseinolytica NRRL Y-17796]|uniref:60S ribosomal protein L6 n=1 Tax=Tortispora caseinolytica NRRL Y-17796 TaxID=767744 RepID=A0A1E4TAL3_9ASCO|nr:hypothetical protein CANCADRAFT_128055 [Tortispora caseinolytica NRRL Y-17796]
MSSKTASGAAPAAKFYPSEDAPVRKANRKAARAYKLRASLKPGAVLILLAGKFRGKRVVLLKALEDGTLLVTGPFKINGVPLRRVNPAYVIATSTSVPVTGLNLDKFTVEYLSKDRARKASGDKAIPTERVEDQKTVDKTLLDEIAKVEHLEAYLGSTFSLRKGDKPHLMQF